MRPAAVSLLAASPSGLVVCWHDGRLRLRLVLYGTDDESKTIEDPSTWHEVDLRPALRFEPTAIDVHPKQALCVLWSDRHVAAVALPSLASLRSARYTAAGGGATEGAPTGKRYGCSCLPVGEVQLKARPDMRVVHATWHPESTEHVLLLGTDHLLRMYAVREDVDVPEQVFRIPCDGAEVVSMCMGKPPLHSDSDMADRGEDGRLDADADDEGSRDAWSWWHWMALVMDSTGAIWAVGPIIPWNVPVPLAALEQLERQVHGVLAGARATLRHHRRRGGRDDDASSSSSSWSSCSTASRSSSCSSSDEEDDLEDGPDSDPYTAKLLEERCLDCLAEYE